MEDQPRPRRPVPDPLPDPSLDAVTFWMQDVPPPVPVTGPLDAAGPGNDLGDRSPYVGEPSSELFPGSPVTPTARGRGLGGGRRSRAGAAATSRSEVEPEPRRWRRVGALTAALAIAAGLGLAMSLVAMLLPDGPAGNEATTIAVPTIGTTTAAGNDPSGRPPPSPAPPSVNSTGRTTAGGVASPTADPGASPSRPPGATATSAPAPTERPPVPSTPARSRSSAPAPPTSSRDGQVYVDPARYVGRQRDAVRAELGALGLSTWDDWRQGTGLPEGQVIDLRPTGWVTPGTTIYVGLAAGP